MDEEFDGTSLLNTLFANNATSTDRPVHRKKRLLPNLEVESNPLNSLRVVVPVFERQNTALSTGFMVKNALNSREKGKAIDSIELMKNLDEFMKSYGITQSQLSRKLNVQQMWLSRMLTTPRDWERLQESGREQCLVIFKWMQNSVTDRVQSILEDRNWAEDDFDDIQPVDSFAMISQISEEMQRYGTTVAEYAKGADVKYSWVYSVMKQPNTYDSFNTSGKRQARQLWKYLQVPFEERSVGKVPQYQENALDTADIAVRVTERLKEETNSIRGLSAELGLDNARMSVNLRQPLPWSKLNQPGRQMFTKLKEWLDQFGDFSPEKEIELEQKKRAILSQTPVVASPRKRARVFGEFPELNTLSVAKMIRNELKTLKVSQQKLADHLGIATLPELVSAPPKWDQLDEKIRQSFRIMKGWVDSPLEEKLRLAGFTHHGDDIGIAAHLLLAGDAKDEELDDCFEGKIFQTVKDEGTSIDDQTGQVTLTIRVPDDKSKIKCSILLIRREKEFHVKKETITLTLNSTEAGSYLHILTNAGFTDVNLYG